MARHSRLQNQTTNEDLLARTPRVPAREPKQSPIDIAPAILLERLSSWSSSDGGVIVYSSSEFRIGR
jgi:hypothetical protein